MIFKAFLTNSMGILCSRIFGFMRDLCMASFLGAGVASDIFFVAFKLPNLFRRIFAEGAFVQSFLPSFIDTRKKGAFSVIIFCVFFAFIFLLSLCVWQFSGIFTKALANGFSDSQIELAKPIVAINFWYLELIFCATFFGSLLQYKNCFWVSAYNTALLNICMIIALFVARDSEDLQAVYVLSYGVLCGGVAQVVLHFYPLVKFGFFRVFYVGVREIMQSFKMRRNNPSKLDSILRDVNSFFKQFFPALLGSSTAQIASFLDTLIASFLSSGAISYLYYANRIFQLPLAIFAIAASSALFPTIAKAVKNAQTSQALRLMKRAFWLLFIILSVCVIGGIMLRNEIIWLLFERGKFVREDTLEVALVFAGYMVGLLPFGLARIFSLWLYAHKMQGKAAKISAISLLCGVGFSLLLMRPFGASGLALASSLGGVLYFALTIRIFGAKEFLNMLKNLKAWLLLVIIALCEIALLGIFQKYEYVFGIFL
ncbi:murein biosynthesis integral membrane protein MurJ [Helicobacter himalayensis]|uniref:murein biosynthesis integral membrane protein MurJ n=1 Tax=Helicobacter himalayensis TaxID=1591088 RepID=UPI003D6F1307